MLVILLNCVTLGMFRPCEDIACDSQRCRILQVSVRACVRVCVCVCVCVCWRKGEAPDLYNPASSTRRPEPMVAVVGE